MKCAACNDSGWVTIPAHNETVMTPSGGLYVVSFAAYLQPCPCKTIPAGAVKK